MLLKLVCSVLHVKYACALVLSMLLALISVSFEKYALVPSWVLHMHSPADDDTFLERGGLGRRHPILTVSVPSEWQANISISSFLAICSIADNGSVVIIYQVPLFSNSAKADGDSVRKRSLLQGISPVSHFTLPNLTVIAMDIKIFEGKLVCVVVSTFFIHAETDVTYSISLFDANAHKIWDKSAPVSPPAVEDIPTSIHIDARCDVSSKICGVVFINLPFHSNSNGICYSTLALSLKTGELLWHFKPGESSASVKPVSISIMEKHWKLALLDQFKSHSHIEESTWGEYRESLMDVLPISWRGPNDGRIVPFWAAPRGIHSETNRAVHKANALAVVHSQGLDVLDLTSGKPLTRLLHEWKPGTTVSIMPGLNESGYFYRSLSHNAVHEVRLSSTIVSSRMSSFSVRIQHSDDAPDDEISSGGDFSHMVDCFGVVKRLETETGEISPSRQRSSVVHSGLCRPHSILEFARLGKQDWLEDEKKATPPLVLKRTWQSSGRSHFWNLWFLALSHRRLPEQRSTRTSPGVNSHDIIFLTSDGSLTSVSNLGYENWRVNAEVSWLQISRTMVSSVDITDHHLQHFYTHYFTPSLTAAQFVSMASWLPDFESTGPRNLEHWLLKKSTVLSVLVSVGWDSVSFVDRYTGLLLATHKLPSHPTAKPLLVSLRSVVDASGHYADPLFSTLVVVPCEGMIVAFGLVKQWSLLSFTLILSCLFVSFLFLHFFCTT